MISNLLLLWNFICVIYVFFVFPACLCATDFPTMRIFREPLIAARPRPSQQDLQHLTTPHDCHNLCVTFTAGNCPIDGCSRWWASGNQRNMKICFFLDTVGMCRMYPINVLLPLPPHQSVFLLSLWYFCPSQKNSGMDQTRSLIWPFLCCISIYWSFILMFGDALKKNVWTRMSDYLGGLFLSSLLLIVIFISSPERIMEAVLPQRLMYRLPHPGFL